MAAPALTIENCFLDPFMFDNFDIGIEDELLADIDPSQLTIPLLEKKDATPVTPSTLPLDWSWAKAETALHSFFPTYSCETSEYNRMANENTVKTSCKRETKRRKKTILQENQAVAKSEITAASKSKLHNSVVPKRDSKRKVQDWDLELNPEYRKRAKWDEDEVELLWKGISKHGNNWTDIKRMFKTRSYCQIKDKGRRSLFALGWETGRSKEETENSYLKAKRIADKILARLTK